MRKHVAAMSAITTAAAIAAAVVVIRQWKNRSERRWRQSQRMLRKFARDCSTPVTLLWQLTNEMVSDMESAVSSDQSSENLQMIPSYLHPLPTGDEYGLYYGVTLRADNFMILCAHLRGKNEPISELQREEVSIPANLINSNSHKELFDFVAIHLAKFVSLHTESVNGRESIQGKMLGFAVAYPPEETVTTCGSAIKWRSLAANDKVGLELVDDMNDALKKHGLDMRVLAMVEDAVGVLGGGRFYCRDCVAGVSLGMSTNAVYVESDSSVPKWNDESHKSREIVIDMQWGNFYSSHLPITEIDSCLDAESSNPNQRVFEKLIAGVYICEIVRKVLLKMAQDTALFGKKVPAKLKTPYSLRSPDVAVMHQDTSEDREVVDEKLCELFGITDSTPMMREVVVEVCDVAVERGARLVGAGIVAIIKKLGRIANRKSVVTIEGGLYEHYRIYRNYLHSSVWEMLGSELSDNVIIQHSHGGSGAAALFLAASQTNHSLNN